MSYYLAVIGREDAPLYELEFGSSRAGINGKATFSEAMRELNPFILHAALDVVDDAQWRTPQLYLKCVDSFYANMISAFVTPGNIRFLLLHEAKNDEAIRLFFLDVWDLYVKTLLSPFYRVNEPITSPGFDAKVRMLCRKYL